jgi:hypothetical protein
LAGSLYFFLRGRELLAQSLASYSLGFFVLGLLFIPLGPLVSKIRARGYLFLLRRAYIYFFLLPVIALPFFMVNSWYWAEIRKVLGPGEPKVEARELLSSELAYLLASDGQEAQRVLEQSFEVVDLNKVGQLTYTAQLKSQGPFLLYFSPPFNPNWVLIIKDPGDGLGQNLVRGKGPFFLYLSSPFSPNRMLRSKGEIVPLHYAERKGGNLWLIEEGGDYELTLEYRGMDRLIVLRWASLAAMPLYLLLVLLDLWRSRENRKYFPYLQ